MVWFGSGGCDNRIDYDKYFKVVHEDETHKVVEFPRGVWMKSNTGVGIDPVHADDRPCTVIITFHDDGPRMTKKEVCFVKDENRDRCGLCSKRKDSICSLTKERVNHFDVCSRFVPCD